MLIIDWWNSLSIASQIFACVAIPATLVLIIQTILMFIGFGGDADGIDGGDVDVDGAGDVPDVEGDGVFGDGDAPEIQDASGLEGLRIFSVRGIVGFLVVFGWVGIVMEAFGAKLWLTLPVATVAGFAMMLLLAFIFREMMKLRADGNIDNRNALGVSGKVQLTIPPSRRGEGKVHILLQGVYVERDAVTDQTEAIPTGSEIVVVGLSGQTTLVVKKK